MNLFYKLLHTPVRRRQWQPTPVLLPAKSHGLRSLVGCSPWGCLKSGMTERLHFHFSLFCTGEGNGNPLQCSCLENPRDGRAWWALVYGVTQSQTRLKWLSSIVIVISFHLLPQQCLVTSDLFSYFVILSLQECSLGRGYCNFYSS